MKIKAGIIGGGGYVAGELIRCLLNHSKVEISFVQSKSQSGKWISETHQDLLGSTDLQFSSEIDSEVDVVFLCLGHGNSKQFLEQNQVGENTKIIDLSNDFRLQKDAVFKLLVQASEPNSTALQTHHNRKFVYGLPELNKAEIQKANSIANPGCFATAIQLGLLPLAKADLLNQDVHIHAITGSTGAGQSLSATSHFSWRNNNVSIYKPFSHQHLGEIEESVISLQSNFDSELNFLPVRGNFTRGIFASIYMKSDLSEVKLKQLFGEYYQDEPFTQVSLNPIHLKQVVNSNQCFLHVQKTDGKVLITSVIDNLLKGAAGQAIQNMNLMFGLDESEGLKLKAGGF
ncbi:MAG: N-acetyl-gamma-glutamyl-phosphate reductase [Flammeovirgaceae bacterium]|jgi:N-acetyl-gamma-glutamyl-phosphate reductase